MKPPRSCSRVWVFAGITGEVAADLKGVGSDYQFGQLETILGHVSQALRADTVVGDRDERHALHLRRFHGATRMSRLASRSLRWAANTSFEWFVCRQPVERRRQRRCDLAFAERDEAA
jgi:hypothetical protein